MKFRFLLPGMYLFLTALLLLGVVMTGGRGRNPLGIIAYLLLPSCYVLDLLLPHLLPPNNDLALLLLCFLTGLTQFTLLGCLTDVVLRRHFVSQPLRLRSDSLFTRVMLLPNRRKARY